MIEWYLGVALLFLGFSFGRLWQAIVFARRVSEIFGVTQKSKGGKEKQ